MWWGEDLVAWGGGGGGGGGGRGGGGGGGNTRGQEGGGGWGRGDVRSCGCGVSRRDRKLEVAWSRVGMSYVDDAYHSAIGSRKGTTTQMPGSLLFLTALPTVYLGCACAYTSMSMSRVE